MKYNKIAGLDKNISKLIMGNDNKTNYDEAKKHFEIDLNYATELDDIQGQSLMHSQMGNCDSKIAETKDHKKSRNQLLESALKHYQKALQELTKSYKSGLG